MLITNWPPLSSVSPAPRTGPVVVVAGAQSSFLEGKRAWLSGTEGLKGWRALGDFKGLLKRRLT